MKHKATNSFTEEEKKMMDTIAANYILAQSDGFQMGYAQAISDFTESITDYWKGSDDEPQQSVLDALVDLGENLARRKQIAKKNIEDAKTAGYEQYYNWQYKPDGSPFGKIINLFTRREEDDATNN